MKRMFVEVAFIVLALHSQHHAIRDGLRGKKQRDMRVSHAAPHRAPIKKRVHTLPAVSESRTHMMTSPRLRAK